MKSTSFYNTRDTHRHLRGDRDDSTMSQRTQAQTVYWQAIVMCNLVVVNKLQGGDVTVRLPVRPCGETVHWQVVVKTPLSVKLPLLNLPEA